MSGPNVLSFLALGMSEPRWSSGPAVLLLLKMRSSPLGQGNLG